MLSHHPVVFLLYFLQDTEKHRYKNNIVQTPRHKMPITQWLKDSTLQNHLRSRCKIVDTIYSGFHIHISFQRIMASVSFMNRFHSTKTSHSIKKLLAAFSCKLNDSMIIILSHIYDLMEIDLHLYTEPHRQNIS